MSPVYRGQVVNLPHVTTIDRFDCIDCGTRDILLESISTHKNNIYHNC